MSENVRPKRRLFRIGLLTLACLVFLAIALVFSGWPSYRQHAIVSAFRGRGFYIQLHDCYPPSWLYNLVPSRWQQSLSSEWSDAFGPVWSITGRGDPGKEFTDADFATLLALPDLRELDLGHSLITDAGLVQLEHMPQLKYLLLDNTQIGDAGVAHLSKLANLKLLHLGNTRITDAALLQLEDMEDLRKISVKKTGVTKDGIARLQRALPDLSQVINDWDGVEY